MIKSVATYLPNKTPLQVPTPEDQVVNYFSFLTLRRLESESQYKYKYKRRVKEAFVTWFLGTSRDRWNTWLLKNKDPVKKKTWLRNSKE